MPLTPNQIMLLLHVHVGTESDVAGQGAYEGDAEHLRKADLITRNGSTIRGDPHHELTARGDALVDHLRESVDAFFAKGREKEGPVLPALVKHPCHEAMQIGDERPVFMVANSLCRQQDCRPEPALVLPPVTVYGSERQANARAIELAVHDRGTNFMVLKVVSTYRVDDIKPVKQF